MDTYPRLISSAVSPARRRRQAASQSKSRKPLKVVVFAHRHPEMSKGGAEIAAYRLFEELSAHENCEAWFIGCDPTLQSDRAGSVFLQPFSDREYIYAPGEFDWFKFANRDQKFPAEISALLYRLAPDVIHFHHYINFGVETFYHVKQVLPSSSMFLTLHEFLAICHHFGQMMTTGHYGRCRESSAIRCQSCFPEFTRSDFFLRKQYIQRFFALVDRFISPSRFLAERYVRWGVPDDKMAVIENVISTAPSAIERVGSARFAADGPLRIGFFGQISRLKGINVLFDAADSLSDGPEIDIVFDIFGEYRGQPPEFQKEFLERLPRAGQNVHFHGPYDQTQVDTLMQSVDAVLIPSIWWENSPVVIQEALRNRRPVICSDIGGMAEKVRDGIDGFHFPAGSSVGLTALLKRLAGDRSMLAERIENLARPPTPASITEAHLELYRAARS